MEVGGAGVELDGDNVYSSLLQQHPAFWNFNMENLESVKEEGDREGRRRREIQVSTSQGEGHSTVL